MERTMQTSAHAQTIDPRSLVVEPQNTLADYALAAVIAVGLATLLVAWWSS
jgi:hypothetical protein